MTITAEQAEQVKDIILNTLDTYHKGNLPYKEVWTKAAEEDFEGVAFVDVWIIYEGERSNLDIRMLNSYDGFLYQTMLDAGIRALPSISYLTQSDVEEVGKTRLMAG